MLDVVWDGWQELNCVGARWGSAWVDVGGDVPGCEMRLYRGVVYCAAVLRLRRWQKVVYCEVGSRAACDRLGVRLQQGAAMSFLKRAAVVVGDKDAATPFPDPAFAGTWPAVYEYMTAPKYPDGKPRKTSSVSLFCEDSQIKACLSDRDAGLVLFGTGRTLEAVLTALEALLTSDEPPWRRSGGGVAPRGQRGNNRG